MWHQTKASEILGIQYPSCRAVWRQPVIGRVGGKVSNAGDLADTGLHAQPAGDPGVDRQIKAATSKPYNMNLWVSDTDAVDGTVSDEQFGKAQELFKSYFDELGIPMPAKPAPFKTRFENQVEVILYQRLRCSALCLVSPQPTSSNKVAGWHSHRWSGNYIG